MTHLSVLFLLIVFIYFIVTDASHYEFNDIVQQKTLGNKIPQCPCVVHKESRQCVSYDSRYLAANIEEAILAFIDLSNHDYSVQIVVYRAFKQMISTSVIRQTINSETFRCSTTECRQCYALLYYRLQEVGLVNTAFRTTISPLPRSQLRPDLCPKFRFLLQPNVPPTPFAIPTFMRDMINAGEAFNAAQNRNKQQQSHSQTIPVPPINSNQNRQQQNQQNSNHQQQNPSQGFQNGQNRPQNNQNNQNNQWNQGRLNSNQPNNWQNQPRSQQPLVQQPTTPNRGFPNPNWIRPPQIQQPPWNQPRPMPQRPWIPQPPRPPIINYPPRVPSWNAPVQQPSWPGNQWPQQPQQPQLPQQPSWTTSPSPSYNPSYNWPGYQPAVSVPSAVGAGVGLGHPILDLLGGLFGGGGGTSQPQHPGGHSGFFLGGGFRHKRQATGDLGVKFTIGCTNRGEVDGELLALCGYCWTWRQLPEDYFPRILNELSCQEGDFCLSGWGMCKQQFRNIDVLHRVNGRWIPTVITSASCCDCRVKAGTEIHSLVVGDKRL